MITDIYQDPFYPFRVMYDDIKENKWYGYRHNWTDGELHHVELRNGAWINIVGTVYDDAAKLRESPGSPTDRRAFAAEPFIAFYYHRGTQLYCPCGHEASFNYPFPGCFEASCLFQRQRQHHFSYADRRDSRIVRMKVTVDGKPFRVDITG